ncbi:hypothetical protein FPV67DRAFT_993823 [Lyophyllum atratum]|nr:hypothetical protein FPV67DRAFT_993823 [Lyophyllum atratum]
MKSSIEWRSRVFRVWQSSWVVELWVSFAIGVEFVSSGCMLCEGPSVLVVDWMNVREAWPAVLLSLHLQCT